MRTGNLTPFLLRLSSRGHVFFCLSSLLRARNGGEQLPGNRTQPIQTSSPGVSILGVEGKRTKAQKREEKEESRIVFDESR